MTQLPTSCIVHSHLARASNMLHMLIMMVIYSKYYMLNTYYSQISLHLHLFSAWYLYSFLEIRQGHLFFTSNNDSTTKTVLPTHSWYPYGCFECSTSKEKTISSLKHGCVVPGKNDLISHYSGPYHITQVNTNGTVHLKINAVMDKLNIHHIHPFKTPNFNSGGCNIC
jgi:hypothetical protein